MNQSILYQALLGFSHSIVQLNTVTNELYVIKWNGVISEHPDTPCDADAFLKDYLHSMSIHHNDLWEMDVLFNKPYLIKLCKENKNTSMILRRMEGDLAIWCRVELFLSDDFSDENPYLFAVSHDLSDAEASFFNSYSVLSRRFHRILRINLQTKETQFIKEYPAEKQLRLKNHPSDYLFVEDFIKDGYVHEEDIASFRRHINASYIIRYFSLGNTDMAFYYRRRMGGLFRWTKISILPSADYTPDTPVCYVFVEDVHKALIKAIDMHTATNYAKFFGKNSAANTDDYYENLLSILSGFTQNYIDFYMVHLDKDLYIQYKLISGTFQDPLPKIGSYSQMSAEYIQKYCIPEERELLLSYSTSEKLREAMRGCLTLEYEFTTSDGTRVKTICQKIESYHGNPVKILCRTVKCENDKKLRVQTFGNFEIFGEDGKQIAFSRKYSKQLLAYLIDRQGYPVTSKEIVMDVLEKPVDDKNAIKYVSTLIRRATDDLEKAGYPDVIIKEQKTVRINTNNIDCDYYHLLKGDYSYLLQYHNEYMKEYSWAENTNAEILSMVDK